MPVEAIYLPVRKTVRFATYPDGYQGPRILAEISETALHQSQDEQVSEQKIIESYKANFVIVQMLALKMYTESPQIPILIEKEDLKKAKQEAKSRLIG